MKIPVIFAFDDNYALPASIAIQSLLDSKHKNTEYEIIVFHSGLQRKTIKKMEKICPIRWIKVDRNLLKNVPHGWSGLETYYRLLMADLLPEYDRVLWSDVDVLFCGDLTNIYKTNITNAEWAGIAAECRDEKTGIHTHFPENKKPYIYMPGFMVANTKLWRKKNMLNKFFDTITKYGDKLKMFDLDVLNLSANKIVNLPFEYCVLENIYDSKKLSDAKEYPWLSHTWSDKELEHAKKHPVIIHYAGHWPKIWLRKYNEIPEYYWKYIEQSPFYVREYFFPTPITKIKKFLLRFLKHITPVKSWRNKIKNNLNKYRV